MMTVWDYRVIHDKTDDDDSFLIHEVYYDDAGKIEHYSLAPIEPFGETVEELEQDLHMMLRALEKPVLEMSDLPEGEGS